MQVKHIHIHENKIVQFNILKKKKKSIPTQLKQTQQ
jgi:hypothetical protein